MIKPGNRTRYYCLSFIEGGSVMACELIGAKLLSPYFGSSLYVWASVLAITLGGLMTGYFLGGRLSIRIEKNEFYLFLALSMAGLLLILMPILGKWIMAITLDLPVQWASVLSLMVFMFPPLLLMGMASPLLINILTDQAKKAGNYAGNVYAISTFGGIIFTFGMGFYFIPLLGVSWPSIICGGLLLISIQVCVHTRFKLKIFVSALFILLIIWLLSSFSAATKSNGSVIKYQSDGLLGQIKVMDLPAEDSSGIKIYRGLFINNTLQTLINLDNPEGVIFSHSANIPLLLSENEKPRNALILGMGGGNLANRIADLGWNVDAVEIDGRLKNIAIDYFNLSPEINVIIDDARHVINTSRKKYDAVIFDLFYADFIPEHVFTNEAFTNCKVILKDQGILLFNFFGPNKRVEGMFGKSLIKTLRHSGFEINILLSNTQVGDNNILIVASIGNSTIANLSTGIFKLQDWENMDLTNAFLLSDDFQYPKISLNLAKEWRNWYNETVPPIFTVSK